MAIVSGVPNFRIFTVYRFRIPQGDLAALNFSLSTVLSAEESS